MHLIPRPLKFAPSVSDFVSDFELPTNADGLYAVRKVVGDDCGISSEATVKCRWIVFRLQSHR
jgi:hypothetical protein